ncbi:hypothetical protein N9Z01_07760 [Flavobacteriaceae bacterium]|nr:hypothetical protein [Flavobacteriaceae bacterium]
MITNIGFYFKQKKQTNATYQQSILTLIISLGRTYLTTITSKVEGLETTITGLMTAVNAIQTSVDGLETTVEGLDTDYTTELAELATGLQEANTAIASLTEVLGNVLTEEDLATISST